MRPQAFKITTIALLLISSVSAVAQINSVDKIKPQESFNLKDVVIKPFLPKPDPKKYELIPLGQSRKMGGVDTGGGIIDSHSDELLDLAEYKNGTANIPFSPLDEKNRQLLINLVYARIYTTNYAALIDSMYEIFEQKAWLYTNASLNKYLNTENLTVLTDPESPTQVIAIQDSERIIVYRPWYEKRANSHSLNDRIKAVQLVAHELLMGLALRANASHDDVRKLIRVIFSAELGGTFVPKAFSRVVEQSRLREIAGGATAANADKIISRIDLALELIALHKVLSTEWDSNVYVVQMSRDCLAKNYETGKVELLCSLNLDLRLIAHDLNTTLLDAQISKDPKSVTPKLLSLRKNLVNYKKQIGSSN